MLPSGSTACNALSVILGLVDTALANKDGVQELAWQATDLMDLMLESQAELEKPGAFVHIMQQFNLSSSSSSSI
jgi:hypothetical protein